MANIVDDMLDAETISRGTTLLPFHRFTDATGESTDFASFQRRYGSGSLSLVTVMHCALADGDTPLSEAELSLLHTMVVAPVVIAFASECLSTYEKSVDELQELSDYLYSHFDYDRSGDEITSTDDINFIRGSAIEYYVGSPDDSTIEHLRWLGSRMTGINEYASVLMDRASVDRALIEELLAIEFCSPAGELP